MTRVRVEGLTSHEETGLALHRKQTASHEAIVVTADAAKMGCPLRLRWHSIRVGGHTLCP
jgi:hypothetical protein